MVEQAAQLHAAINRNQGINFQTDTLTDKYLSHSPLLLQAVIVVVDCTTVYAGNIIRKKGPVEEFTCSLCCWFHFFSPRMYGSICCGNRCALRLYFQQPVLNMLELLATSSTVWLCLSQKNKLRQNPLMKDVRPSIISSEEASPSRLRYWALKNTGDCECH